MAVTYAAGSVKALGSVPSRCAFGPCEWASPHLGSPRTGCEHITKPCSDPGGAWPPSSRGLAQLLTPVIAVALRNAVMPDRTTGEGQRVGEWPLLAIVADFHLSF